MERTLLAVGGVKRADVSYVSGSATAEYDEAVTSRNTIKATIIYLSACSPPRSARC